MILGCFGSSEKIKINGGSIDKKKRKKHALPEGEKEVTWDNASGIMLQWFNFSWILLGNYYYYSYVKDEENEFFILGKG